jgi:hypothetical protein
MNDWRSKMFQRKAKKAAALEKRRQLVGMGQLRVSKRPSDKQLDRLWSEVVMFRDRLKSVWCRICHRRKGVLAYHIVPKQMGHAIRWLLENGVLGCVECNGGEVSNRTLYRMKHCKMFGEEFVKRLENQAVAGQGHPIDRWAVKLILERELERLKEAAGG